MKIPHTKSKVKEIHPLRKRNREREEERERKKEMEARKTTQIPAKISARF